MIGWILLAVAIGLFLLGLVREGFEGGPTPGNPCGTLGRPEVRGGVTIRVYTKPECDALDGNFSANGECSKKTGGSFTWDCRNAPVAAAPAAAAAAAAAPAAPAAPAGDPCGTLGRSEVRGGATIRVYTRAECDTLGGTFSANGECSKKTGGSFSWDCRNAPAAPATPAASAAASAAAPAGAAPVTGAAAPVTGAAAGGTTGGTSDTSAAPNAGGGGTGKQVFGPTFTSLGAAVSNNDGDSTRTNKYPELMGGMGDQSVRGPGGIRNPSQNWLLSQSGALPSTASLGSDANSAYLPYSRTPGDQDLIPDPYRMNRNYSTSSYSSKTDPVPFLTDFSAFSK